MTEISTSPRRTATDIIRTVARDYGYTVEELTGPRRFRGLNHARFIAMDLLRRTPALNGKVRSMEKIGDLLGGRDHTTVRNGLLQIAKLTNSSTTEGAA